MKIYDITRVLNSSTPIYPGDPEYIIKTSTDNNFRVSKISMGSHTGTHIDAPKHLISCDRDIDSLSLDIFMGKCFVFDLESGEAFDEISQDEISACIARLNVTSLERILLKTSKRACNISLEACKMLFAMGLKIIGIDKESIEQDSVTMPIHHFLLENNVPIIEFLDLKDISEGEYTLIALPLRLEGADASPCRVILTS